MLAGVFDGVFILAIGGLFVWMAWWMRTHEFWTARNDRQGYETHPTPSRVRSYRLSRLINRWIAPLGLLALGISAIIVAVGDVWNGLR